MTSTAVTKWKSISLRLQHSAKSKIERAARLDGKNVSQFIIASALKRAEKTIQEHEVVTLNARESEVFFNALAKPVRFNKALREALESHNQIMNK